MPYSMPFFFAVAFIFLFTAIGGLITQPSAEWPGKFLLLSALCILLGGFEMTIIMLKGQ